MPQYTPNRMSRRESPAERFQDQFGTVPTLSVHAPGRVNLLGAHVDYHEGLVLPGAIDRGTGLRRRRTPRPMSADRRHRPRAKCRARPRRAAAAAPSTIPVAVVLVRRAGRVRHVAEECARVRQAATALADGEATELGRLMSASHASSRDLYEVSIPELDSLAQSAAEHPACLGARLSGGGFGGCVMALVTVDRIAEVASAVARRFERLFGRRPPSFACSIADGAAIEVRSDGM